MELRDYMRGLRRHWLAIVLMTAIGVAAGYGWTLLQTPVYTASASGYVASQQSEDVGISTIGDNLARSRVQSYLDIAGWRAVAESDPGVAAGVNVQAGRVTNQAVAKTFGLPFVDWKSASASRG